MEPPPAVNFAGAALRLDQSPQVLARGGAAFGGAGACSARPGSPDRWLFDDPALKFGGYFENNSGADDAELRFYDASGALLGSMLADIPADARAWTWNGWASDEPFVRIDIAGNGLINGFIWYEDMQVAVVPEAGGLAACLLIAGLARRGGADWRRNRKAGQGGRSIGGQSATPVRNGPGARRGRSTAPGMIVVAKQAAGPVVARPASRTVL